MWCFLVGDIFHLHNFIAIVVNWLHFLLFFVQIHAIIVYIGYFENYTNLFLFNKQLKLVVVTDFLI